MEWPYLITRCKMCLIWVISIDRGSTFISMEMRLFTFWNEKKQKHIFFFTLTRSRHTFFPLLYRCSHKTETELFSRATYNDEDEEQRNKVFFYMFLLWADIVSRIQNQNDMKAEWRKKNEETR